MFLYSSIPTAVSIVFRTVGRRSLLHKKIRFTEEMDTRDKLPWQSVHVFQMQFFLHGPSRLLPDYRQVRSTSIAKHDWAALTLH